MLTITGTALNVLTLDNSESEYTTRVMQGTISTIATASGALIRVINDLQGPIYFHPVELADAIISSDGKVLSFDTAPAWVHVSQHGEKFLF